MVAVTRRRPRVTPAEREAVEAMARDKAELEMIGLKVATRIGARAQAAAMSALKSSSDVIRAATRELEQALPALAACMVTAHLAGAVRSNLLAPRRRVVASGRLALAAPRSGYAGAVRWFQQRLDMPQSELEAIENQYEAEALRVVRKQTAQVERKLQQVMQDVTRGGAHVREGRKAIAGAFQSLGLTPANSFTVEAIFRTQTALAYGAGRWQMDQDEAVQEILWGYKYVTVGDDRVRPAHVGFDGVTLPKDHPFWKANWPPNGWACRCATIPVFDDAEEVPPPATIEVDGKRVVPEADEGFRFNAGQAWKLSPHRKEFPKPGVNK